MGKNQEAVESSDSNWPTIGFYVPIELCTVISSPIPTIPYDPHAKVTFVDPFTSQTITPSVLDGLVPQHVNRWNGQVASSSGILSRFKRKLSCVSTSSEDWYGYRNIGLRKKATHNRIFFFYHLLVSPIMI
jgi:hypothetical protein